MLSNEKKMTLEVKWEGSDQNFVKLHTRKQEKF